MSFRPWKILDNLFKINTRGCTFIKIASITTDLITANELIWESKPWHLSSLFQPKNGGKGTREKDSFYSSKGNYSLTIRCLGKIKKNSDQSCFRLAEIKFLCLYLEFSGSILQNISMKIIIIIPIKSQVKYFYGRLFSLRKIVGKLRNLNLTRVQGAIDTSTFCVKAYISFLLGKVTSHC